MSAYLEPIDDGRRIILDKAIVFVGRNADCDVILTRSRKVSRKHCCVAQVGDRYVVRDLDSMNGVRVNGERIRKQAGINFGDEVCIGDCRYLLKAAEAPAANQADGESGRLLRSKPAPPDQPAAGAPLPSEDYPVPVSDAESGEALAPKTPSELPIGRVGEGALPDDDRDGSHVELVEGNEDSDWQLERHPE